MKELQALLIGKDFTIMLAMPALLNRAGLHVDCITNNYLLKKNKFIRNYFFAPNSDQIPLMANAYHKKNNYNLIIATDDETLRQILIANLPIEEKLKLLPVQQAENIKHITSKIGLSIVLEKSNLNIPAFIIINNQSELIKSAQIIGFPVLIKIDYSGGGSGVYDCLNIKDILKIQDKLRPYPVLMQKKIAGDLLDLSSFYQNGKLIHFSYSRTEKVIDNKFGPSSLRAYVRRSLLDKQIFDELSMLGQALGAHGFVNISCIQATSNNKRYFFEADMRPNVWIDFSKYFGDDPAPLIQKYFTAQETLKYLYTMDNNNQHKILLPYFLRIKLWEVLINRYQVWNYMPEHNIKGNILILIYANMNKIIIKIKRIIIKILRPFFPDKLWLKLKYIKQQIINQIILYL